MWQVYSQEGVSVWAWLIVSDWTIDIGVEVDLGFDIFGRQQR